MSDFINHFDVNGSALTAERSRMRVISSNIANANVTRSEDGGPFKRKLALMKSKQVNGSKLDCGATIDRVMEDTSPPRLVYDPEHPDADTEGYVAYPNVNILQEVTDLKTATLAYQANLSVIGSTKKIISQSLELGRS